MAKALAGRVVSTIAEVTPASIEFVADDHDIQVAVPTARLRVLRDLLGPEPGVTSRQTA